MGKGKEGRAQLWDIRGLEGDVLQISEVGDAADQLVLGVSDDRAKSPFNFTAFFHPVIPFGTVDADLQHWYPVDLGNNEYAFRNGGTFRYLDAESRGQDEWSVVARNWTGGDSQVWI
eukprot:SRR837773.21074.p1 GENE.SRR837773.21074~~SRR837773.21074.p1  ORF type:complete len:133 (-),score=31.61 SRR837773.21074:61-411(-)